MNTIFGANWSHDSSGHHDRHAVMSLTVSKFKDAISPETFCLRSRVCMCSDAS